MEQERDLSDLSQTDPGVISAMNTLLKNFAMSIALASYEMTKPSGAISPWILLINTCLATSMSLVKREKYDKLLSYAEKVLSTYKAGEPEQLIDIMNEAIKEDADAQV